ncbi:hypothetical protein [Thermogemmatispora carboxidivorans]|uniref:hypothetical protein n=1 Tax=Thermogemmatispora carboxidivorans TaxID=1382306 RepID=UPI00069AE394|nr:hypothetical protein [Thermogemmatispora carboxidivorans]
MGVDITGWIECRQFFILESETTPWEPAIRLGFLFHDRNYDAFGCLFGVKNYANFRPVAEGRGLPTDVSPEVRAAYERWGDEIFGASWITWAEIKAIDWEEPAELPDARIHCYRRAEDGSLVYEGKSAWDRDFAEVVGHSLIEGIFGACTWPEGQEWEIGGKVYRSVRLRRKDARASWKATFSVMEALASNYGDDGVRMIVWFYS